MGNTFKDMSTVRAYSPSLIAGRAKPSGSGAKEGKGSPVRSTREGRMATFFNDSPAPRPSRGKSAIKYGK